jgi:wobble nucleotide-excising tRNase
MGCPAPLLFGSFEAFVIHCLRLLRNIGQFDSVATTTPTFQLQRNVFMYAENGRGKTTLTAILRSLQTGNPVHVLERRRLSATQVPHVIVDCAGGPPAAMFQNGVWNRIIPDIAIFDDRFVDENVFSGLDVASGHRQNLHELIIGSQGVALNQALASAIQKIEVDNGRLRNASNAIPVGDRGGLSVDDFCDLQTQGDIENAIRDEERSLAALQQTESIRTTPGFDVLTLPDFDVIAIDALLQSDMPALDASAIARVQQHLATIGEGGEVWISQGMSRIHDDSCPFCAQQLEASPVLGSYREYFGLEYANLKREIAEYARTAQRTHGGEITAAFERSVRVIVQREQFWRQFAEFPELTLDTASIVRDWQTASRIVAARLAAKAQAPLDQVEFTTEDRATVEAHRRNLALIERYNEVLTEANRAIAVVRERATNANAGVVQANLARLRAVRARHMAEMVPLCNEYLAAKQAKRATEQQRETAKQALEQYRATVFPGYQTSINHYLSRFNAGFQVDRVASADTRGGPTCNYSLVVNNTQVPVSGGTERIGEPGFKTVLSAGDRNTLALAFFFAALEQDPGLANKIVVIDDPVSSLDDHRMLATTLELRRFSQRVSQTVVLSHSKPFLCRLWETTAPTLRSAFKIERDGNGSTLAQWDVNQDAITEHDRRTELFNNYRLNGPAGNSRDVAVAVRPHLEAYLRVACPATFPPGTLLGNFLDRCRQVYGHGTQQILDQHHMDELFDLKEYSNLYHHDTNAAWETEVVNDGELLGFVGRLLSFTAP